MYRLSSIIFALVGLIAQAYAQSPHGESLKKDCAACHVSSGWLPVKEKMDFNHDETDFPLEGSHMQADCKGCHTSLVFADAPSECASCHKDIHSMSVGNNCARCHTPQTWIVDNIPELHEANGFPLVGSHSRSSCVDCHVSETNLRFDRIGNDCINCHQDDYSATKSPDHQMANYSTNCAECHDPFSDGWNSEIVNHDFFPLTFGHDIQDCKQCHLTSTFSDASPDCISCHLNDYSATKNPNHTSNNFSKTCSECHDSKAWIPSNFDHNTIYPLQGAHKNIANNCVECHAAGYTNTPNTCVGCHLTDYNTTTNPNHTTAQFSKDCKQCHTELAWIPSNFNHNTIYPLVGAHQPIANNCIQCHAGGYVNTPNTCAGCHLTDYNATTNPNHAAAQFPTDCKQCHTESAWIPSSFDHDGLYFPIYSGKHREAWNSCTECHTNSSNYAVFSCIDCHQHNDKTKVDSDHQGENGYVYASSACLNCHPTGN